MKTLTYAALRSVRASLEASTIRGIRDFLTAILTDDSNRQKILDDVAADTVVILPEELKGMIGTSHPFVQYSPHIEQAIVTRPPSPLFPPEAPFFNPPLFKDPEKMLTDRQRDTLQSVFNGETIVPSKTLHELEQLGLVKGGKITDEGIEALHNVPTN